jgi:hypothetical protein
MTAIRSTLLQSKDQTGHEMHRLINNYYKDIKNIIVEQNGKQVPLSSLPIDQAFNYIKNIPYRQDTRPFEIVARPEISARNQSGGLDCKKKSILMAAYLKSRGIPYRLVASSRKPSGKIHHVFPQMQVGNQWFNLDATYSHYKPGQQKTVTNAEVLK